MNSILLAALGVLALALVVAVGVLAYRREQARARALRAWASAGGWQLVDQDDRWATVFTGPPFGAGEDRRARFVWLDHGHDPATLTPPLRKEAP